MADTNVSVGPASITSAARAGVGAADGTFPRTTAMEGTPRLRTAVEITSAARAGVGAADGTFPRTTAMEGTPKLHTAVEIISDGGLPTSAADIGAPAAGSDSAAPITEMVLAQQQEPAAVVSDVGTINHGVEIDAVTAAAEANAASPEYSIDVSVAVPAADSIGVTSENVPEITITFASAESEVIAVVPSIELTGNVELVAPAAAGSVVAVPPTFTGGSQEPSPIPGPAPRPRRRPERKQENVRIGVRAARIRTNAVAPRSRAFQTELDDELIMFILNG